MNIRDLDLNLLTVLRVLLNERHVSQTAECLGISQPSVSRSLQRLRNMFNDELLIRTPTGYNLTERAQALKVELDHVLDGVERLFQGKQFNPLESDKMIKFFGLLPEINWLLPPFFSHLRSMAPNMTLSVDSSSGDHFEPLEAGDVHFVISAFTPTSSSHQLYRLAIAELDFKLLMSANHPLANEEITLENFLKSSLGSVSIMGFTQNRIEKRLKANGHLKRGESLHSPIKLNCCTAAANFSEVSDVIFLLPAQIATDLAKGRDIVLRDAIPEIKPDLKEIYLYWHQRHHTDEMCIWVREQFKSIYK
ncbi:LysR family transcriptional regulator [Photobacterium makurazakiensis]|uniref:LysR family transcriptional regulator n=1 Tax=Photobacterium TaxID=657 RepID=UPI003D10FFFC